MSEKENVSGVQVPYISALAEKIEARLHNKGAFREVLPMHLDRHKFRWLVRNNIERVITDHMQPDSQPYLNDKPLDNKTERTRE